MFVAQLGVEGVNLLDFHLPVAGRHLLEQRAAALVAGGKEHQVVADNRRRNDRGRLFDVVRPEQFAVGGPHAHGSAAGALDIDARAADFGDDRRSMPCPAVSGPGRLPECFAGPLVERHHRFLLAPRGANQAVAVDQYRLAITPAIGLFAGKVLGQVFSPNLLPAGRIAADQLPKAVST